MTKISAEILADSLNEQGDRITTFLLTFPRFILAELNTHRMFSKNSASSRAIPFEKMIEAVQTNPFIPIAWQKDHKGMQGTEYILPAGSEHDHNTSENAKDWWLEARDSAVHYAKMLSGMKVTKQLCNRLLEPFMWHTVILTATEFENFFSLRCPQYEWEGPDGLLYFRSKKNYIKEVNAFGLNDRNFPLEEYDDIDWLYKNKGQAEIHMMSLAEAMWDARNESTPEKLLPGQWHIPYGKHITIPTYLKKWEGKFTDYLEEIQKSTVKISTAMCARVSYTVVGNEKEMTSDKLIELHDKLINQRPLHASPMEHCARAMTKGEYHGCIKGSCWYNGTKAMFNSEDLGWSNNFKGFIQYRKILETN